MGVFSRLSDIVNANLHSMLDRAEDPAKMIRLIIQEMEDTLVEVRSSSVKTIARRKQIERELAEVRAGLEEWAAKAELALSKNREDLARAALLYKSQLNEKAELLEEELKLVGEQLDKLDGDIRQLNAKLKDARARQRALVMRHQNAGSRVQAKRALDDAKLDEAKLRFTQFEQRIERMESEAEASDLGRDDGLDQAFAELENDEAVEAELAALKRKLRTDGAAQD